MKQQYTLMKYDPATGEHRPYPSNAHDWRKYHEATAWLYNPWSGDKRDPRDIDMDVNGLLIIPKGEPIYAGSQAELEAEETECVHMCLDNAGVPRADEDGAIFSLWGRVLRFKQMGRNVLWTTTLRRFARQVSSTASRTRGAKFLMHFDFLPIDCTSIQY